MKETGIEKRNQTLNIHTPHRRARHAANACVSTADTDFAALVYEHESGIKAAANGRYLRPGFPEEQVQGYSIQTQLRACREWADKHGYSVGKEYLEEGHSAFRNLEKREALKELLADSVSK